MSHQPSEPSGGERRQTERLAVELPGEILVDGVREDCLVYDISPDGALLSASDRVAVNSAIRLKVTANGEFVGVVVWRRDDRMGLKFMQFEDDGMRFPDQPVTPLRKVS